MSVQMPDDLPDDPYIPDDPDEPDSSGGGCDTGLGSMVLLLLIPMALNKYRKK